MYYNLGTIMPLFSLTDITFGNSARIGTAASNLSGSSYNYNMYRYPNDLGNYDKGHYIVFHINEQTLTQFSDSSGLNDVVTNAQAVSILRKDLGTGSTNFAESLSQTSQAGADIVDALKNSAAGQAVTKALDLISDTTSGKTNGNSENTTDSLSAGAEQVASYAKQLTSGQGLRTTKRTRDTIALYMPDTLVFNDSQHFNDLQMGDNLGTGLMSAVNGAIEGYRANGGVGEIGRAHV